MSLNFVFLIFFLFNKIIATAWHAFYWTCIVCRSCCWRKSKVAAYDDGNKIQFQHISAFMYTQKKKNWTKSHLKSVYISFISEHNSTQTKKYFQNLKGFIEKRNLSPTAKIRIVFFFFLSISRNSWQQRHEKKTEKRNLFFPELSWANSLKTYIMCLWMFMITNTVGMLLLIVRMAVNKINTVDDYQ